MWGEVSAVPLERAMGKYNAALAKCPIVDGQEKIPTGWRNQPRIDDLKALITDTKRTIEEKYVANSTLKGALRIVLSSNNMQMIKGSRDITPDDAEALTSRMIHIDVTSPAAADYLKTVNVQEDWLDNGMLARHFLWLTENRNPARGTRLRLPPSSTSDMGAVMRENSHASFQALKVLLTWLETWSRATEPSQDDRVQWSEKDNTIRVTATGMQALLKREYGDRYSVQSLGATLRLLSHDRKIGTRVAGGSYPPMWVIPIEIVAVWAEREGWSTREEVLALVAQTG